jgi:hypothetical protein
MRSSRCAWPIAGRQEVYEWSIISVDGRAATRAAASAVADRRARQTGAVDILFVCGGINVREAVSPALLTALRGWRSAACRWARCAPAAMRSPRGACWIISRHHSLGESLGAARGVSAGAHQRPAVHHRPRPLHLLGRHRAAGPDAEPHSIEAGPADLAAGVRAIHRRSGAQGHRPAVRSAARAGRSVASRPHPGGAAHGGEHREAAVAGERSPRPRDCRAGRSSGCSSAI